MTRSPRWSTFPKIRKRALEGTEETITEPKEGTVAILNMTEAIRLNWN
jgi:hypothetical protein